MLLTGNREQGTGNREQGTGNRQFLTFSKLVLFALLLAAFTMPAWADEHIHGEITFQPWNDTNKTTSLPASGSYYLTEDVNLSSQRVISSGNTLNLCLNGHTFSCSDSYSIQIAGGTLNLYDEAGNNGKIENNEDNGTGVSVNNSGKFTMNGGSISVTGENGTGVYVSTGTFNMSGGSVSATGENGTGVCGAYQSAFTMSGGSVSGGLYGVLVGTDSTFNASGNISISGGEGGGVELYDSRVINISSELTNTGNKIAVLMKNPGVFTSGWKTHMS
ncbi:MAG: hypothetical protein IJU98_08335, partial [Synergistaceae bacterium]|nr:hypothetical protein [Synergistaceae bacterium]